VLFVFFFFQAEDGIRDVAVTGVQTCALPISFGQNKVALLVDPNISLSASSVLFETLVSASNLNYLWFEGALDISNDLAGIALSNVNFSVVRNVTLQYGTNGIVLTSTSNNFLSKIKTSNQNVGVNIISGENNTVRHVTTTNNSDVLLLNLTFNNNISHIVASNNNNGIRLIGASNNTFSQLTSSNNSTAGINLNFASNNNSLTEVTSSNNETGLNITDSNNNILAQMLSANNNNGLLLNASSFNTLANMSVTDNNVGITLTTASNNNFSGKLQIGNNAGADCVVFVDAANGGIDPGLDDDIAAGFDDNTQNGVCLQQGRSTFGTAVTDVTLANSFVGKVIVDDTTNTNDINGSIANYPIVPTIFDWTHFDNGFRAWGIDGSVFPASDQRGMWNNGPGHIWD